MMMDIHTAAAALDGNEYREEGSRELFAQMKEARLVAVFGASDDLVELRGAIDDEVGSIDTVLVTSDGLLVSECGEGVDCPYFTKIAARAATIHPRFDNEGYTFTYSTDIPHVTFDIVETEGEEFEKYCRGIVFSLDTLA